MKSQIIQQLEEAFGVELPDGIFTTDRFGKKRYGTLEGIEYTNPSISVSPAIGVGNALFLSAHCEHYGIYGNIAQESQETCIADIIKKDGFSVISLEDLPFSSIGDWEMIITDDNSKFIAKITADGSEPFYMIGCNDITMDSVWDDGRYKVEPFDISRCTLDYIVGFNFADIVEFFPIVSWSVKVNELTSNIDDRGVWVDLITGTVSITPFSYDHENDPESDDDEWANEGRFIPTISRQENGDLVVSIDYSLSFYEWDGGGYMNDSTDSKGEVVYSLSTAIGSKISCVESSKFDSIN
jgi:hypothetical protein